MVTNIIGKRKMKSIYLVAIILFSFNCMKVNVKIQDGNVNNEVHEKRIKYLFSKESVFTYTIVESKICPKNEKLLFYQDIETIFDSFFFPITYTLFDRVYYCGEIK